MNREILFRGKNQDGKWVYGHLVEKYGTVMTRGAENRELLQCRIFIDHNTFCIVDPETVGQYTGLRDINNMKIFEGDIVSFSDYSVHNKGVVCLDINGYWVDCSKSDNEEDEYFAALSYTWIDKIEVIGNVYDNPELLK